MGTMLSQKIYTVYSYRPDIMPMIECVDSTHRTPIVNSVGVSAFLSMGMGSGTEPVTGPGSEIKKLVSSGNRRLNSPYLHNHED